MDDHLCFKLYVASRLIMRGYGERLAPFDLTYPKYLALLALSEADGQTVGQLAERLSLDFGTLSPLLKSLAESGYVARKRRSSDERVVVSTLTKDGRAALKSAMGVSVNVSGATEMTHAELVDLRDRMDEYIARCQRVVERKPTCPPLSSSSPSPSRKSGAPSKKARTPSNPSTRRATRA